ncbi:MAG TPA: hypothetical protein VGK59_19640 [Ohtaekwangia sp.]
MHRLIRLKGCPNVQVVNGIDQSRQSLMENDQLGKEIRFMISRFPAFKDKILNAYGNSDEFKGLCEDFYSSSRTLEDYKEKVMKDIKNELEYRKLFLDLENEILKYLGANTNTKS